MNDEEFRESEFPTTWDNSMDCLADACKRKFYWFARGYDYSQKPSYFTWGSAWQEIMLTWYEYNGPEKDPESTDWLAVKQLALEEGLKFWDNEGAEDKGDNQRNRLEIVFDNYLLDHPSEPWEFIENSADYGWVWPISGTDYYSAGSLDGQIFWKPYGRLVFENKTEGNYLSDPVIQKYTFSTQLLNYIWYLNQLAPGEVFGALVNLVTKKVPGPRSQWSTPRTDRKLVQKTPIQLSQYMEERLWRLEEVKKCWNNWYWPKTTDTSNCCGGPGKAPCLYRPVCMSPAEKWWELDPSTFEGIILRKEPWEPWKRIGGQES